MEPVSLSARPAFRLGFSGRPSTRPRRCSSHRATSLFSTPTESSRPSILPARSMAMTGFSSCAARTERLVAWLLRPRSTMISKCLCRTCPITTTARSCCSVASPNNPNRRGSRLAAKGRLYTVAEHMYSTYMQSNDSALPSTLRRQAGPVMPSCACLTLVLLWATSPLGAAVFSPKVGDPAPPLIGGSWLKGDPVPRFEPGHVYLIDIWAPWCGPCLGGMAHLTELQHRNRPRGLVVIGLSGPDGYGSTLAAAQRVISNKGAQL